jgi:hypothetical protein
LDSLRWPNKNGKLGASTFGADGDGDALTGDGAGVDALGTGGLDVAGGPAKGGAAGWADPAGSAGFGCTIFSRFSSTLKLNRRRFGLPRRPPSDASTS